MYLPIWKVDKWTNTRPTLTKRIKYAQKTGQEYHIVILYLINTRIIICYFRSSQNYYKSCTRERK